MSGADEGPDSDRLTARWDAPVTPPLLRRRLSGHAMRPPIFRTAPRDSLDGGSALVAPRDASSPHSQGIRFCSAGERHSASRLRAHPAWLRRRKRSLDIPAAAGESREHYAPGHPLLRHLPPLLSPPLSESFSADQFWWDGTSPHLQSRRGQPTHQLHLSDKFLPLLVFRGGTPSSASSCPSKLRSVVPFTQMCLPLRRSTLAPPPSLPPPSPPPPPCLRPCSRSPRDRCRPQDGGCLINGDEPLWRAAFLGTVAATAGFVGCLAIKRGYGYCAWSRLAGHTLAVVLAALFRLEGGWARRCNPPKSAVSGVFGSFRALPVRARRRAADVSRLSPRAHVQRCLSCA